MSSEATKVDYSSLVTAIKNEDINKKGEVYTAENTIEVLMDPDRTWYVSTNEQELDDIFFKLIEDLGCSIEDGRKIKESERRVWHRYRIGMRTLNSYVCPVGPEQFMKNASPISFEFQGTNIVATPIDFQPTDITKRRKGWDTEQPYSFGYTINDPKNSRWGWPVVVELPDGTQIEARFNGSISLKGAGKARLAQPLKDAVSPPDAKVQAQKDLGNSPF